MRGALICIVIVASTLPLRGEDFADALPRIAATEPADTIANFSVADGFRIELVASEPLIGSPVAVEWDARGRMYVCEMRGYSENRDDQVSTIGLLEDTDGDGVYDRRTEFADGLFWPTAIFPFDGGLFVGDAPDLLYLKDTDGDGKADSRKVVLTGFGTSNVQGLMNSFRWGLDNRIHIACSSVGGTLRKADQDASHGIRIGRRDIAFDPRTFDFEVTSGAAQHGMCFDDWGRKFVSSNSDHIQQVMYQDRHIARNPAFSPPPGVISIAADGPQAEVFRSSPVEPWRIVRTRLRVAGEVPGPIEGGGRAAGYFTGATGITIYRGDAWPANWKGTAIVGDVGSNLIHRKRMELRGVQFIAKRIDAASEFVTSSDIWFRPAQFANAPDGSLYVIDVCREVIEHPKSLPPELKKHLDLTSGRDRGRIYRIVPQSFEHRVAPELASTSTEQLVALLEHSNAWHRETAARVLYERQDQTATPALRRLAQQSDSPLGRMHALYALAGLSGLDAETLASRLSDPHPQVRRHAVLLTEGLPDVKPLANKLLALVDDPSIEVRCQLGWTIGSLNLAERAEILAALTRSDVGDRWVNAAVHSSLAGDASNVFATLLGDSDFRSAAAREFLANLARQIGLQDKASEVSRTAVALSELPEADGLFALPILGEFLQGRERKGSVLARMSEAGSLAKLDKAVENGVEANLRLAVEQNSDLEQRVAAIELLWLGSLTKTGAVLSELLDSREPTEIQLAAIRTLGKYDEPSVAATLLVAWQSLSPRLRETAGDTLFARPERTLQLFDAIDAGEIDASALSQVRLEIAAMSINAEVKARATQYLSTSKLGRRADVVADYQDALGLAGNGSRGRAVFVKHCSACHRVEGVGSELGPNLESIKTRGPETILVNVLAPSREVNPEYLNYVLLTQDGRTITGMLADESASSVLLRRAENASDTVLRVDIERLQSTGLSIMPEGLEESIDKQAMADLISYLMQL